MQPSAGAGESIDDERIDVSREDVRLAWGRLQKAVHPDLAGDNAAAAAALVNEAYEVLSSDAN